MMVVTHVVVGLLLAVPVALVEPSMATPAAVGALVGGIVPDFDMVVGEHRRTLHFPVAGPVAAVLGAALALLAPSPWTVALALALLAAGVHSLSDVLGAGEELRPWERTNPHAVYDHVRGRWLRARYVVPYDGSPRDLGVTLAGAVPVVLVFDGWVRLATLGAVGVGVVYTLLRRRLVPYFAELAEYDDAPAD